MPLQASARTLARIVCPGSAGVLGVVETRIVGALAAASATTRSVNTVDAVPLRAWPSLTVALTVKSPI
jgi:hypothetical protein